MSRFDSKIYQQKHPLRWGIIGCGDVTERKSGPAYQKVAGSELYAVMRRDREKARDYAARHQVPVFYDDADALINDPAVDAVYIATPPDSHKHYALKVAAAGLPCCIEKPMAPGWQDCVAIVQAFEQKKLPLFVAYYRRSLPRFLRVKEWLDSGAIGEPRQVSWIYSRPPLPRDKSGDYNWRTDSRIAPGGYFDDLASHGLDLFCFLFGEVEKASGFAVNQQQLYSAKDSIVGCWQHRVGVTGTGSWNFGSAYSQDRVQILGSSGRIEFAIFENAPLRLESDSQTIEQEIAHPENIQLHHVENMMNSLRQGSVHPSSGQSGAHTSWVMDQILGKQPV